MRVHRSGRHSVTVSEPRKCDICLNECKGADMPLESFRQGARCDVTSESLERMVRQRNGLECA